jgi:hypothetical protein
MLVQEKHLLEHFHVRVLQKYVLISSLSWMPLTVWVSWLVWQDLFIQSVQNLCLQAENLRDLLEEIRGYYTPPSEVVLEDLSLPGLAELKGHWHGSLDASGGGNGDTLV